MSIQAVDCRSHLTAISRNSASVPARILYEKKLLKGRCLDFGCGYGKDAETFGMEKFDKAFHNEMPKGTFDTITCTYVLNTVMFEESAKILLTIRSKLKKGGCAYITVRNDVPLFVKRKNGTVQRRVKLKLPSLIENKSFTIYKLEQK